MSGGSDFEAISSKAEQEVLWLRVAILEGVSHLESVLDQLISLHLTVLDEPRAILEKDLLPRVPINARVSTLRKLLDIEEVQDSYPFFAMLPGTIRHRNVVAHMTLDIFESSDECLVFSGWKSGEMKTEKVSMVELQQSSAVIWHSIVDLQRLYDDIMKRIAAEIQADMD